MSGAELLLQNAQVVDCVRAEPYSASVSIREGRIAGIGSGDPKDHQHVVDLEGKYWVMPGLVDLHVHLVGGGVSATRDRWLTKDDNIVTHVLYRALEAQYALRAGITRCRIVGEHAYIDVFLKEAMNSGLWEGPSLTVSGPGFTVSGGHGHSSYGSVKVNGPDEIRDAVRRSIGEYGVDLVKLLVSGGVGTFGQAGNVTTRHMTKDEMVAACEVARFAGKPVVIHAGGSEVIRDAVHAGVSCVEHGFVLDSETASLMAKHKVALVPTLAVTQDPERNVAAKRPQWFHDNVEKAKAFHLEAFQNAMAAGVTIGAGTDNSPNRKEYLVRELKLFVKYGMSAFEALKTATITAAEICGTSQQEGSIELGKTADLLVGSGNPMGLDALRDVAMVIQGGRVVVDRLSTS